MVGLNVMEFDLPREILLTSTFKKHIKDRDKIFHPRFIEAVYHLMNDKPLAPHFCDHALTNKDVRECHIKPDMLLVYQKKENFLILLFLTNHNDLNKLLRK